TVVDLRSVESVRLRLGDLFQVRPELQVASGGWKPEGMIVLGTRDKQDAVPEPAPRVRLGAFVIGPQHGVDAGLFRRRKNLFPRSQRVWSIFGVDVDDRTVIVIDA